MWEAVMLLSGWLAHYNIMVLSPLLSKIYNTYCHKSCSSRQMIVIIAVKSDPDPFLFVDRKWAWSGHPQAKVQLQYVKLCIFQKGAHNYSQFHNKRGTVSRDKQSFNMLHNTILHESA